MVSDGFSTVLWGGAALTHIDHMDVLEAGQRQVLKDLATQASGTTAKVRTTLVPMMTHMTLFELAAAVDQRQN
jgi:hypothetical protein